VKAKASPSVWPRALALAVLFGVATTASAQQSGASVDISGLRMRYADSVNTNAVAVTPALWSETDLTSVTLIGTLSNLSDGGWSAQGGTDVSLFTHRIGLLLGEIEGTAGGSARKDGSRTGQLLGSARAHVAARDRGVWAGAGIGTTWDGASWHSVKQGEAAAWTRVDAFIASVSATPVWVDDSIRYTDAQLVGGLNLSRVEVNVTGGFRAGSNIPTLNGSAKSWGSATITGWIRPGIAVVGSAGTYPVDLTQGYPGGRFASLGIRLGARQFMPESHTASGELRLRPAVAEPERSGATAFQVNQLQSGRRELRVLAPQAGRVEITGDFTDWQPVPLVDRGGGWWAVSLPISVGIHEMNLRVDGGAWTVPPGLTQRSDEFGGAVGVLVVH
jgi:hypothetical protein